MPQDKPVVVFRFVEGEPGDAIDARSLSVTIDGANITPAFRIAGGDAWGSLTGVAGAAALGAGAHQVFARICSERGACGSVSAVVNAEPPVERTGAATAVTGRGGKLLDFLIRATRRLLLP